MSREKIFHLRALGAEVVLTRSDVGKGHPEYYQDIAQRHRRRETPAPTTSTSSATRPTRSRTRRTTGPGDLGADGPRRRRGRLRRRLRRHDHRPDALLRARRRRRREMVLADPGGLGPRRLHQDRARRRGRDLAGRRHRRGLHAADRRSLARERAPTRSPTRRASPPARELLARKGILGGSSSGTLLAAALRYCREQTTPKRVVTFVCDSGNKYLSKMFNDYWMADQGFLERARLRRPARPDQRAASTKAPSVTRRRPTTRCSPPTAA